MSKINTKIKKKRKLNTADNLEKQISGSFRCTKNRISSVPLLYRLVYSSKLSFITVFILLLSFVCQGASLTYADETSPIATETEVSNDTVRVDNVDNETEFDVTEKPEVSVEVETSVSEESNDLSIETEDTSLSVLSNEEVLDVGNLTSAEGIDVTEDDITSDTSPPLDDPPIIDNETPVTEIEDESLPNNDDLTVIDNEQTSTTTSSSTAGAGGDTLSEIEIIADETPPVVEEASNDGILGEFASTTETSALDSTSTTASTTGVLEEAITITNSDTEFTFNRSECTALASGSFYCLKAASELLEDALFSAPDVDGDLEIYLVRDGIQSQVTSNLVDDAAPFFDQNSNTIVWHRLIDDRYQIVSYDISSGVETQLTSGDNNSMEPTRQGKYTVWQNWSNNNWNIVLFDGKNEITITESSAHDIAPYIHGSLVVWNRYSSGQSKTIEMYDMISETYVTVDDPEGLSVTNPRMVFVYDSLHPNGDVVTKGYDMISRKFIQLDTLPRQLPDEIPQSESTGETRALIQSKPTVKSDEISHNNNATSSGPTPPNLTPATSTDVLTLDLSVPTSTEVVVAPVLEVPPMAEYELVIAPLELPAETVQE